MTSITSSAAPSGQRAIRWRTLLDRVLVLILIIALWQAGSLWFGAYWLSSPWATTTRFVEQILNGELLRHAGYTLAEAGAGTMIGGLPAGTAPVLVGRPSHNPADPQSV